jgi:exopolyphosphatase / guanosine-5'-triphosphate,3'-diphosphate pyrophosphatase
MSERLAVLDLGSNAVRLILATVTPGVDFRVLRQERVQTRLADHRRGLLPRAAVEQTLKAVSRFLAEVRHGSSPRVLAVATAAIRDAPNADRLLAALRREEGVKVRVLSGLEEARLGAAAVLWRRPLDRGAIVDLGGGSLQVTRVRAGRIARVASVPLGAVRTTLRFLRHDPPRTREIQALRRETRGRLLGVLPRAHAGDALIGLGGSLRALGRVFLRSVDQNGAAPHWLRLRREEIAGLRAWLEPLTVRQRRRVRGLKAERADVIVAGAVVIEELMTLGGYEILTVCDEGVRHGLLLQETFRGASSAHKNTSGS